MAHAGQFPNPDQNREAGAESTEAQRARQVPPTSGGFGSARRVWAREPRAGRELPGNMNRGGYGGEQEYPDQSDVTPWGGGEMERDAGPS